MKLLFALVLPLIAILFYKRNTLKRIVKGESKKFLENVTLRGCDLGGCGHFGASRGNRTHKGLDVLVSPDDRVDAPFDCKINRLGKVYANDQRYNLIEVLGTGLFNGYKMKIMYAGSSFLPSDRVFKQGEKIGFAQDITIKHSTVQNHIHLELYNPSNVLINPEIYV